MSVARLRVPDADFSAFGLPPVSGRFDPLSISVVQALWSAKDAARLSLVSGNVASWADRKAGLTLTDLGVAGYRPAYSPDAWEVEVRGQTYEMPALVFNGLPDGNVLTNKTGPFATTQTVLAVYEPDEQDTTDTATTNRPILCTGKSLSAGFRWFGARTDLPNLRASMNGGTAEMAGALIGEKQLVAVTFASSGFTIGVNGAPRVTTAITEADTPQIAKFTIGGQGEATPGSSNYGRHFKGKVAEVIVVNGTLNQTDYDKLTGHLAWEWGLSNLLPANHPYRLTPPSA